MSEIALNVPFDSQEIIHIVSEELKSRMSKLSPLTQNKEYSSFSVDFQVNIRLRRSGEDPNESKETLAWGTVDKGDPAQFPDGELVADKEYSRFDSKSPNEERVARDLPLTVESGDGRGGRVRRKVRVKGA